MQASDGPNLAGGMQSRSYLNGQSRVPSSQRLTRDNLVSVAPSDWQHMPLVKAMRGWRRVGARSFYGFEHRRLKRETRLPALAANKHVRAGVFSLFAWTSELLNLDTLMGVHQTSRKD